MKCKTKGSTTCVMVELEGEVDDKNRVGLKTTNLGDSGYIILRPEQDGSVT